MTKKIVILKQSTPFDNGGGDKTIQEGQKEKQIKLHSNVLFNIK